MAGVHALVGVNLGNLEKKVGRRPPGGDVGLTENRRRYRMRQHQNSTVISLRSIPAFAVQQESEQHAVQ